MAHNSSQLSGQFSHPSASVIHQGATPHPTAQHHYPPPVHSDSMPQPQHPPLQQVNTMLAGPVSESPAPTPAPPYLPHHHHHHRPLYSDPTSPSAAAQMYTPTRVATAPADIEHSPSPSLPYLLGGHHPYRQGQPLPPPPRRQQYVSPQPDQQVQPRIPTLAELEQRPSRVKQDDKHSRLRNTKSRERPTSRPTSREGTVGMVNTGKAVFAHEGIMDSVELAMEGAVRAAEAL